MNQLSSNRRQRRGLPLIIRYLFLSIVVIVVIVGNILGFTELDKRQDTETEVNNLYEIAEIQIAAQYNGIIGDALNVEAITRTYVEEDIIYGGYVRLNLERIYENLISNSGKYAAITFVPYDDNYIITAGEPKSTEVAPHMFDLYAENARNQVSYAFISEFNHSEEVKEVTFTVTIPVQDNMNEILGFVIMEPYMSVIIKDVERALANSNIFYELLTIDNGIATYVYSDIDKSRGSDEITLAEIKGNDIAMDLIYGTSLSGSFNSPDGVSYYHRFEMPVSNYYGERHNYLTSDEYMYVLTLPQNYFDEITKMDRNTFMLITAGVSVLTLLIAMLLFIAQNNRRRFTAKTTKMAQVDTLTGLLNRAYFTELFEDMIEKDPEAKYAILFMDLDGFKDINDSYGHNMGDKVLRVVANRLVMAARREDLVSRFGGDEFAMLISYNSIDQVKYVSNKVVRAIGETIVIEDNEYQVGVSIGVAIYPDHARTVDDLYKVADNAMYKVKYSTKNSYYISKGDDKIL